ncbi:nitric oxide reductase transcriptional regulator NorR [Comamonas jiangduensis]|uniref:nitric oxide reductase transcriptional regulator NorR n=1 Tax=Comamonas jiangduensis TaxID=1194168 RepID=UPI003BF79C71
MTTPTTLLNALLPLVAELPSRLPETERYRRLLAALRAVLPGDAAALLRCERGENGDDWLRPLAIDGLSPDTLGRRFRVAEHPRFAALLAAGQALRFPTDTDLPDPYDGLVAHHSGAPLPVHDCMGCVLQVDGQPWGLLTLDALQPGRFAGDGPLHTLQAFCNLASATVATAAHLRQLEQSVHNERQRAEHFRRHTPVASPRLLGHSAAMRALQRDIATVAASDLAVLITGETGVGKELVAQALHAQSDRADQAFVSINCAALPDTLVESELFGHVRGAFTGAVGDRQGKFEQAHQGTLFLDEVGELPLVTQAKLLRVLQSGQIQRLGLDRERTVDVRILAATNQDLAAAVHAGRMRADFFHRLSVYPLQVPPLRAREGDVLVLAGYFLERTRSQFGLDGLRLEADAQSALLAHHWPGNVRELEHAVRRAVLHALRRPRPAGQFLGVTAQDFALTPALIAASADAASVKGQFDVNFTTPTACADGVSLRSAVAQYERHLVEQALQAHGYRWAAAARALHMDRANLQRLTKRLGLMPVTDAP